MKLRLIGILILVLAGQAAAEEKAEPTQEQAIAAIRKLGGKVTVDKKRPGKPVVKVEFGRMAVATNTTLVHLKGFTELNELSLAHSQVTNAGLSQLKGLTNLESLNLYLCRDVGNAGFVHLKGMTKLRRLIFLGDITGRGLYHLKGLTKLEGLSLTVSDADLVHLMGLTNLRDLTLKGNKVSDAGLVHLKGLTTLRKLILRRTTVTAAGVNRLRAALPNCKIEKYRKMMWSHSSEMIHRRSK